MGFTFTPLFGGNTSCRSTRRCLRPSRSLHPTAMELANGLAPLTHISFPGSLGLTGVRSWQAILAWEFLPVQLVCCSHFAALDDQFPLGELKGCDVGGATHSIDPMYPIDPIDAIAPKNREIREICAPGGPGHFGRAVGLEVGTVEITEGRPWRGPGHQLVATDLLWI